MSTIQFQDEKSNQIQPWKGSYYLAIAGTSYTELVPFKISSPTGNVKLTVSYIPDYANIAAFTGDTNVTAANISVVSGLAPKKTPVMLQDSKGNIYLETSDANTGVYSFFVPTGTYGIGLIGRKDANQGADTNVFGSKTTTASSINYAGSGNTEAWYTIKTVPGQVTCPLVNSLSPDTAVTANLTPDSAVIKNASAPKIFGKVAGALSVSTIGFNYVKGTGTADPVIVSGKITAPKTGDQTFSITLPNPFDGSKMELVYSNTPNNATFDTSDFDFSSAKITMKVTVPTAASTYDKDIKLTIASTSTDSGTKAFETKALTNTPDYLLYSTTTTFPDTTTGSAVTDVSNKDKGVIAISTNSKAATGVAYYVNGSLTIKAGTLPKAASAGYYFKVVSGRCWSGDTTGAAAYTVNAPLAAATLKASVSKTGASDSTHTTLTITNADTTNNDYYYEYTSAQVRTLTTLEDFTKSNWTKISSLSSNTAQIDGSGHTTDYLTIACSPKSGSPTYVSIKLSAASFPSATSTQPTQPTDSTALSVTAAPGSSADTMKLNVTPANGDWIGYRFADTVPDRSLIGDSTRINNGGYSVYLIGSELDYVDIPSLPKYIIVVEVDTSACTVVKIKYIALTASNVNTANTVIVPTAQAVSGSCGITYTLQTGTFDGSGATNLQNWTLTANNNASVNISSITLSDSNKTAYIYVYGAGFTDPNMTILPKQAAFATGTTPSSPVPVTLTISPLVPRITGVTLADAPRNSLNDNDGYGLLNNLPVLPDGYSYKYDVESSVHAAYIPNMYNLPILGSSAAGWKSVDKGGLVDLAGAFNYHQDPTAAVPQTAAGVNGLWLYLVEVDNHNNVVKSKVINVSGIVDSQ